MPTADGTGPAAAHPVAESAEDFARAVAAVRERIARAAAEAGRRPADVRLLPVSKTVPEERIRLAVRAGCGFLGENKVQEARRKAENLADLDGLRVAEALDRRFQALGRSLDVFVQVNTSGEESKFGLAPDEAAAFIHRLPDYSSLNVRGLMTLAVF